MSAPTEAAYKALTRTLLSLEDAQGAVAEGTRREREKQERRAERERLQELKLQEYLARREQQ